MYAIFVGLGFAMTENMLYYVSGINSGGLSHGLSTFWLRGVMTPLLHPFFTSMTALGIGLSITNKNEWVRAKAPMIGLFLAFVFHSVWNASGALGNYSTEMVYYFVCLPMMFFMAYLLYTNSQGDKL
jgi:RsiW-degrading membrane proteinase PrsW (M82 family)